MSEATRSPRRRRRLWIIFVVLLLSALVILVGLYYYLKLTGLGRLAGALEDTQNSDSRWRLSDVEADRATVPDSENSATVAIAAKNLLPEHWPYWDFPATGQDSTASESKKKSLQESFENLEPNQQLNPAQITALRGEMKRAAESLAAAGELANMPRGRYPIKYSRDFINTLIPHTQDARVIADLLAKDAMMRAEDKDLEGALVSCRGILNVSRSIGDEPLLISQLVRIACRSTALLTAERTLAQGEPSSDALARFQADLEKDEVEPLLMIALRGERGGMDQLLEAIHNGTVKVSARDLTVTAGLNRQRGPAFGESLLLHNHWYVMSQRAAMLRFMNRAIAAAKLPLEERQARFDQLDGEAKNEPVLVRLLVPALSKVSASCTRSHAQQRCAIAALAAERYRRARSHWPDDIAALKDAGFLAAVPIDPYDGKPLRFRRTDNGVVAYSIGPDREDNGGKIDSQHLAVAGSDIGFRLWDPPKRRQLISGNRGARPM